MHLGQRAKQRETSRITVRFRKSASKLLALMILALMAIPAIPIHAQTVYLPGVHVGDSVTYGQISVATTGTGPPPSGFQVFNDSKSITETVTSVDLVSKTVGATQAFLFKNGTSQSQNLFGSVADGSGTLNVFILAGGLSAGDPPFQTSSANSFFGFLTETVTREYAGALRTVNLLSFRSIPQSGINSLSFAWDQQTGFLLDVAENATTTFSSSSSQTFSIKIKATSTNIWNPSSAMDFGFDAITQGSPLVHLGQSASYTLNLTSFTGFAGSVNLSATITNSSLAHLPALGLGSTSVMIPSSGSVTTTLTFSTDASTTLGLYLFSAHASGSLSHDALFAVSVQPPTFALLSSPTNMTIARGSTAASKITAKALGLFSGTISLSASPSSPSITASLNPTTVHLSSTAASVNSTLSLSVGTYAVPGDYSVYVTGTSGQSQQSAFIPVNIMGPQFRMSVNASSLTLDPGRSAAVAVTLTSVSGFSGTVVLADSSYGPAAISLSQTSIVLSSGGTGSAILTISVAPSASPGSSISVSVTGISGLLDQTQSVFVSVPNSGFGFSMSASPSSLTIEPGQNGNFTIALASNGGFSGHIALATQFYGSPLGYVFSSTNVTVTRGGTATSTLKVSAPATIPQGSSNINVYANSGNLSQQAFLSVNIGTPPVLTPDFDISAFPPTLLLAPGTSGDSTITLDGLNGFSGNLALSASLRGGPPGVCPGATCPTVSLERNVLKLSSGASNSTTVSVTVPTSTPHPSFYTVVVTATNGSLSRDTSVTVGACPCPSLQASFNTNFVTIIQGTSIAATLILSSFQGFSGTISLHQSLTVFGQNCQDSSCPSISLSPMSAFLSANGTATSTLTIDTNSTTTIGRSYSVQVVADSTSQTAYAYLSVNVVSPTAPDFTVSSAPLPLIITPGNSAPMSILLSSLNGFSGKVTLSSLPGGAIAISPNFLNLTVASGGSAGSILTISVQANVPSGFNFVYLTGTSGILTHALYLPVIVAAPDFSTVASLTSLTVQAGGKSNSTIITIPSLDGLQGSVSLDSIVQPCFSGICPTVSFNPPGVSLSPGGWTSSNISVSAPTGTPPGSYFITVNVASGLLSHAVYLSVLVTGPTTFFPDFGVFASPSALTIAQGGSEDSTIAVNSLNGFSGTVTLSPATPPGITAVLASGSLSLTPGGTSSATLSVSVASTTATGFYSLTVTGTNGTVSHPVDISVRVVGPDFEISANPGFLNVPQGGSGISVITLGSLAGFAGTVTLSASGDLATSFSPSTVFVSAGGSASSNFTINAFAPTPGVHYLTVTAFAGIVSHSITITVDLTGPDFNIFAIPSRLTVAEGASALSTITLTGLDGFSSPILLTTFSPYGLQSSVNPADVTLSKTMNLVTAGLNVTVPATLVPGSFYYVTVTGTNGILAHSVNVPVIVTGPDFTISADPTFLTIEQGKNATSTISLSSLDGFQGTVELSANSFGALSMSLNSTVTLSSGGTGTATLRVFTTTSTPLGGYTFFVTGTSGILSHYTDVFVTVAGPDFRISANPHSLILMAGQSANSTISLDSIDGFAGIVKLSISVNGVTASLNPLSVALTPTTTSAISNLTISVPATIAPGFYGIGVTGVNGSLSHTIGISVEVIGPDFTIVSNPAFPSPLKAGQTTLSTITLRSLLDFSGLVTLTISSPILSASLSSTDINLALGAQASADLNVTVPANTAPGSYAITVTGVSGLLSHTTYIFVSVIGPDFSVGVVPFSGTVPAGTTGTFSVLLESLNGFSGTVNLSTTSANGFTTTLNSGKITLPSGGLVSDGLEISVPANTLTGTYRVDVTATNASGVPVHNTFVQIYVLAQNFTLITFPSTISIQAGSAGKSIIDVVGLNGFSGTVALTIGHNTQQLAATLGSVSLKLTPGFTNSTALTISTTTSTTPGVYLVVVNGTIGSLSRSVTVRVGVTAPSQIHPTSTTLVCGSPVVVNQASTCTATVTDTSTSGATSPSGTVTFSTTLSVPGSFDSTTCNLVAGATGTATCSVHFNPLRYDLGPVSVSASYGGDSSHDGSSSSAFSITVNGRTASTTVICDSPVSLAVPPNPSTCTIIVTDTDTAGTPLTPYGHVDLSTNSTGTFSTLTNQCELAGSGVSGSCTIIYSPTVAGVHRMTASHPNDGYHLPSSGFVDITVSGKATPTIATTLSATAISVGGSVADSSTLASVFQAGGTVTYNEFSGAACAGTATVISTVTVTNGLVPDSRAVLFNSTGSFSFNAVYSGDANNVGATSACEPFTVGKVVSYASTVVFDASTNAAWSGSEVTGASAYDTASLYIVVCRGGGPCGTLPGLPGLPLSGTVGYTFYSNGGCSGTGVSQTVTLNSIGRVPNSTSTGPLAPGTYSLNATYSGDPNYFGSTSPCEPLTVNMINPTISTTLSATTTTVGGSVSDSSTLSNFYKATGTVTYEFFTGSVCRGTATTVGTPITVANGLVPNSMSQTFNSPGSYSWNAVYSGDASNSGATSPCESLTVNKASPTLATLLSSSSVTLGNAVSDSSTLTGSFQATGTLAYSGFSNNLCTAPGKVVSIVDVTGGVVPNSRLVTFNSTGDFGFQASYGGDANNSGATSPCEPLSVTSAGQPVLLSFKGFDLDDYENGLGQLQVFVNGHLVVDIPAGLNHLSGSGDYTLYTDRWINFGPFDITSFVVNGRNNVTFTDLNPADHFGLVRNVMIAQGSTVLLNVGRTAGIYPGHSKTYTFSIPPLTITSFTISPKTTASNQVLTFTATYTGGTAPFTCAFRFGDGKSVTVAGSLGTCTVTHEYNQPGTFMVTVTVRGSSTSDIVRSSLAVNVT